MKRCTLLLAAIALAACSEQALPPAQTAPVANQSAPEPQPEPQTHKQPEPEPEPFADVKLPPMELNERWLVLNFVPSEYGPKVGIGDGEAFGRHYLWEIRPDVDKYLRLEDAEDGLPGAYVDSNGKAWGGLSGNPLVLRAWAHLSSSAIELIDMCSENVRTYHYVFVARMAGEDQLVVDCEQIVEEETDIAEPPPPEQPPDKQVEYPTDEMPPVPEAPPEGPVAFPDDEPGPADPSELQPWQKETVTVTPVFDRTKEIFGFQTEWARQAQDHENTAFKLYDLCSREGKFDRAHYEKLRARLAAAILKRIEEDEGGFVDTIRVSRRGKPVTGNPEDKHTSWLVFLLQIDAVNLINQSGKLGNGKLNITWSPW